jgi:hypothetical protein
MTQTQANQFSFNHFDVTIANLFSRVCIAVLSNNMPIALSYHLPALMELVTAAMC